MQFYTTKLITMFFIITISQIIVHIIISRYYVKGLAKRPEENVFKSAEAKEQAIRINTFNSILMLILYIYITVTILVPLIIFLWKQSGLL